jgi:hypothetical protein
LQFPTCESCCFAPFKTTMYKNKRLQFHAHLSITMNFCKGIGSKFPSKSTFRIHFVSFVLLSAAISISCMVVFRSKRPPVMRKESNNDRKLLFIRHSIPYPHIYSMPDYQSASTYNLRFPPSRSYTEYNSYFGTGKRFWRKPTPMCSYDEEDKQALKSTPSSDPGLSKTVRYDKFCS